MITPKYKNIVYVLEGFVVLWLLEILFAILAGVLHFSIPFAPVITMALLSSVIACTLTILYLLFRTRFIPIFTINNKALLYSGLGIVIIWFFHIISSYIFDSHSNPFLEYIKCKPVYKYINIICFIILVPITEEIVYRGYFVKLLIPKGTLSALLITSVLFVTSHLLLHNYSSLAMLVLGIYFFIFSMTAGFIYTRAGLVAAILVHMFNNLYVLVVNI